MVGNQKRMINSSSSSTSSNPLFKNSKIVRAFVKTNNHSPKQNKVRRERISKLKLGQEDIPHALNKKESWRL